MEKFSYVGTPTDLRNDIMKQVDNVIRVCLFTFNNICEIPHFLEWNWGECSSQGGYFTTYEMCRLEFKNNRIPRDVKKWVLEQINIPINELNGEGIEVDYETDYIEFRKKGDKQIIRKEVK